MQFLILHMGFSQRMEKDKIPNFHINYLNFEVQQPDQS